MNNIFLKGRLTKDAELRYTQNQKEVASFSLAVNTGYGDNKRTDFFNCTAWGATAKAVANYTHKGDELIVIGSMINRKWKDKEDKTRDGWEVNVQSIEFCGSKKAAGDADAADFEPIDDSDGDLPF